MTIYFDMDGTIANLYSDEKWLEKLRNYDAEPYQNATPLFDMVELAILLLKAQNLGYKIGIVSWLSKVSTPDYDKAVRKAKRDWLEKYLPIDFDEIHIVKYGTPKSHAVKDKYGILFDDEANNRNQWKGMAYTPNEIFRILKALR